MSTQDTKRNMGKREKVVFKDLGALEELNAASWPSGDVFLETLRDANKQVLEDPVVPPQGDAAYWQASARWALLRKYGYDGIPTEDQAYQSTGSGVSVGRRLVFSDKDMEAIQSTWDSVVADSSDSKNDLVQLLQTGRSNNRKLQWAFMDCAPGCQFNLHAHPNVELVYCAGGSLHEIRMKGEPYTKDYERLPGSDNNKLKGPNLTQMNRPWYFDSLQAGEWLVNEVGSIHKSFTATSGQGCLLLVLWGGSHADIVDSEVPVKVNVQEALNGMDDRLGQCECTKWDTISETFLPESEKSSS